MRNRLTLLIMTLTLLSCGDNIEINKQQDSKTYKVTIKTTVDNYSKSEKRFYGDIEMCNLTMDTIIFNFNQLLFADNDSIEADWNLSPVSYACIAFEIVPKDCKNWKVFWPTKKEVFKFENIYIKDDTTVSKSNCRQPLILMPDDTTQVK